MHPFQFSQEYAHTVFTDRQTSAKKECRGTSVSPTEDEASMGWTSVNPRMCRVQGFTWLNPRIRHVCGECLFLS